MFVVGLLLSVGLVVILGVFLAFATEVEFAFLHRSDEQSTDGDKLDSYLPVDIHGFAGHEYPNPNPMYGQSTGNAAHYRH